MIGPDAVIGQIGLVSYHLGSLLGAIEPTILCAFVCIVGYFDAQTRETLVHKSRVWLAGDF